MKTHVVAVLCIAALLIAAGLYSRSRGGGIITRWIAAHQADGGH